MQHLPLCRRVIDAKVLLRDSNVYMRKCCPDHHEFAALIYGDAELYTQPTKFNKPGAIPLELHSRLLRGCPYDCGLCPRPPTAHLPNESIQRRLQNMGQKAPVSSGG